MSEILAGAVSPEVESEFPGIGVRFCFVAGGPSKTPAGLSQELDLAADRITGAQAVRVAAEPVAALYRALRAQLGMDPSVGEGTAEDVIRRRLLEGGFRPSGIPADAITLATLETGIPLWAFGVSKALSGPRISLWSDPSTGVVELRSDDLRMATLFGEPHPEFEVTRKSEQMCLVALVAPGVVPEIVELALERAVALCVTS